MLVLLVVPLVLFLIDWGKMKKIAHMISFGTKPLPVRHEAQVPIRNRRRRVRHQVFIPAFTGMNGNSTGIVLDLYEILNLSEEGMCFQSASQMDPGEVLNLC